jgi:hypothetical protein
MAVTKNGEEYLSIAARLGQMKICDIFLAGVDDINSLSFSHIHGTALAAAVF